MKGFRNKLLCSAVGASGGLAGILSLSKCSGGGCASCFGCLGMSAGILLVALINRSKRGKERQNGMA